MCVWPAAAPLRLYPPLYILSRESIEAVEIGPYLLPARTVVFFSPFVLQRRPDLWLEPRTRSRSIRRTMPFQGISHARLSPDTGARDLDVEQLPDAAELPELPDFRGILCACELMRLPRRAGGHERFTAQVRVLPALGGFGFSMSSSPLVMMMR
jgi:hypothetical protein